MFTLISKINRYGVLASLIIFVKKIILWIMNRSYKRRFNVDTINIGEGGFISDSPAVTIDNGFHSGTGLWMESLNNGIIHIGRKCRLSNNVHITSVSEVRIGDNVLIGSNVLISDHSHGEFSMEALSMEPYNRPLNSKGGVVIGSNVWICDGAFLLSGVKVGDYSIIAANSVVIDDVPPYCLVAGSPAKIRKCLKK